MLRKCHFMRYLKKSNKGAIILQSSDFFELKHTIEGLSSYTLISQIITYAFVFLICFHVSNIHNQNISYILRKLGTILRSSEKKRHIEGLAAIRLVSRIFPYPLQQCVQQSWEEEKLSTMINYNKMQLFRKKGQTWLKRNGNKQHTNICFIKMNKQ